MQEWRMPNPSRLDLVHKAIRAGVYGNVEWDDKAYERFVDNPEMKSWTPKGVKMLLRDFVAKGGQIDVRDQGFELWLEKDPDNPYWYRAVIPVAEFPKGLFVELI